MPVKFRVRELKDMTLVEFEIEGGVLDVSELPEVVKQAPEVPTYKGVCISGRGPVWLFSALTEKYHPTRWVATYEPRLNKCVVTATHHPERRVGDLVDVEPA